MVSIEKRRYIKKVMLEEGVPKETIEKVITNCNNRPFSHGNLLNENMSSRIILYAFTWDESPEGWDFWNAEYEYWKEKCE